MSKKRKQLSKKVRFEVFKRDGFICYYCGKRPPESVLEVDHMVPVSKGGSNALDNLITSCFDCNRGKSNTNLDNIPPKLYEDIKLKKEKESQLLEYREYIENKKNRIKKDIDRIDSIYSKAFNEEWVLSDNFREKTVKRFIAMLPLHEVESAMKIACEKIYYDEQKALKYFCGVCWGKFDLRNDI